MSRKKKALSLEEPDHEETDEKVNQEMAPEKDQEVEKKTGFQEDLKSHPKFAKFKKGN